MTAQTALTLLLAIPLGAAPVIYLAGRIALKTRVKSGGASARILAVLALLAAMVPLYYAAMHFTSTGPLTLDINRISLQMDGISLLVALTALILGLCVTFFSTKYMQNDEGEEKFFALLMIMIVGIIGLVCATDLFNLWVWFEVMAVSSYLLVAFYRSQPDALEAGVKYLVQSATGSVFILLGIALTFAQTGVLNLHEIRLAVSAGGNSPIILSASVLMLIGFGVKAALVPLHTWLPDAHSQAPSGISAMLSGIVIEAGLVALLRSTGAVIVSHTTWGYLIMAFGALNLLVGNLMALRQTQVKRMLAYSSVSQMGYILVGIGVAVYTLQPEGAAGGFFHVITHSLMKGAAFLAAGALLYALRMAHHNHEPLTVSDLDGASQRYPVTAFFLAVALLALGGLPPLAGFMSKWQIFVAGFQSGNSLAIALVIFAAINSVLSLGYYAPLVNRMYRHEPSDLVKEGKPISWVMVLPLVIMTVAIVALGIWPPLVRWLTTPAAMSLLAIFGG
jgi:proton-translocating NADH-quinone oxidoreductase chain N